MKKLPVILLLTLILSCAALAQKTNSQRRALPVNVASLIGEDPDTLLSIRAIKARFKKLLGKNYTDFTDSFETRGPFEKKGNYIFSSGCLIHACSHLESAVAVDLVNHTIHAAIFRENEKVRYFNEDGGKTPAAIRSWTNNLTTRR